MPGKRVFARLQKLPVGSEGTGRNWEALGLPEHLGTTSSLLRAGCFGCPERLPRTWHTTFLAAPAEEFLKCLQELITCKNLTEETLSVKCQNEEEIKVCEAKQRQDPGFGAFIPFRWDCRVLPGPPLLLGFAQLLAASTSEASSTQPPAQHPWPERRLQMWRHQESKALLTSEPSRALGFFLHLLFHQQEWDDPPAKRCPIHPAQQGQSPEEQLHLTDPHSCRDSCQAPTKGEVSSSVQKPLLLLCLLLCPFPPVPNYHPVELHSCWDPRPQPRTAGFSPASHRWC